jgi:LuxR family maltose regulon positive regulatory protein
VRTFADRGPRLAELLNSPLEKRPHDPYLHRLLNAFDVEKETDRAKSATSEEYRHKVTEKAAPDTPNAEILSNREIDVLALLKERLSNKEIVERLFVSPETVKKHTINIYRKLNVSGRRQAVTAARKQGFLPVK